MRAVLLAALLVSSQALIGCTNLEKLDRQTDDLLDKMNNPGGSTSSSSRSSGTGSGLSVVRRPNMTVKTVKDAQGRSVAIWGQSRSSSTTPGHDRTMEAKALSMALSGDYEYVTVQRSWRTATGRVSKSRRIPDIIGVRRNGKVDAYEIKSKTDNEDDLEQRIREGMRTLPARRRGAFDVLKPDL